jgi:chitosanase
MTELQKKAAEACVNVLETGSPRGNYGDVTVIAGDAGHLTYGRSQTTLASGGLHDLVKSYCEAPHAKEAATLRPYLKHLEARDVDLDRDEGLKFALRRAGADPVMREMQDKFFDERYWAPAERAATALQIETPLGVAVVYDSHVHGSWGYIRDRTTVLHGVAVEIGEKEWIVRYIETRRAWFEHHSNAILHKSVRRMDAFKALADAGNWDLSLPFTFRSALVSEAVLDGEAPPATLRLGARGEDVRRLQQALVTLGAQIDVDGDFGEGTLAAVEAFQREHGLAADGVVGARTWAALDGEVLT